MRGEISVAPRSEPPPGLPQAVVLEGNYWKRRIEVVMREYHKWRIYYKKRVSGGPRGKAGAGLCCSWKSPRRSPRPPLRPSLTAPPCGHRIFSQPPYFPGRRSS